jgi:hypothetical protein
MSDTPSRDRKIFLVPNVKVKKVADGRRVARHVSVGA